MTETQRRFLREIAARVGDERVHEVIIVLGARSFLWRAVAG